MRFTETIPVLVLSASFYINNVAGRNIHGNISCIQKFVTVFNHQLFPRAILLITT